MGLTRRAHARAIRLELAALIGLGILIGAGLSTIAVATSYQRFDLDPMRAPSQLLSLPLTAYAVAILSAAVIALVVSAYAQRVTDRADAATVLRVGD